MTSVLQLNKFNVTQKCIINGSIFTGYNTWSQWSPGILGNNVVVLSVGRYARIGYQYYVNCNIAFTKVGNSDSITLTGLPEEPNDNTTPFIITVRDDTPLDYYAIVTLENGNFTVRAIDTIFLNGIDYLINFQTTYTSSPYILMPTTIPKTPFTLNTVRVSRNFVVQYTDPIYRWLNMSQWPVAINGDLINITNINSYYTISAEIVYLTFTMTGTVVNEVTGKVNISLPVIANREGGAVTWSGNVSIQGVGKPIDQPVTCSINTNDNLIIRYNNLSAPGIYTLSLNIFYNGVFT